MSQTSLQMHSLFWCLATFTSTSKVTCCSFEDPWGQGIIQWLLAFPTKVSGFLLCGLLGPATSTASHSRAFQHSIFSCCFLSCSPIISSKSCPSDPFKNHFIVVSVGVLRGNEASQTKRVLRGNEAICGSMGPTLTIHHHGHGCPPACLIHPPYLCFPSHSS